MSRPPKALREALEQITYASDDGSEYEHNEGCEGEAECAACWVLNIRQVLAAHPAPSFGTDYEETWRALAEGEMRHRGYTDAEIDLANRAPAHTDACAFEGMHWVCSDEDGNSHHPMADEYEEIVGVLGRALETLSQDAQPLVQAIDRNVMARALFEALQPDHLEDHMFAGERMDDAEALADEVIGRMTRTLRTCRVCGCSQYRACMPSGCAWVPGEADLCTSCVTDQGATAPPTSTAGGD